MNKPPMWQWTPHHPFSGRRKKSGPAGRSVGLLHGAAPPNSMGMGDLRKKKWGIMDLMGIKWEIYIYI